MNRALPDMPKGTFAHDLLIHAPSGCRLLRGGAAPGHSLHREKSATCEYEAANGNTREVEIRREDQTYKALKRFGKDPLAQDDPAASFVRNALVQDSWLTSGFGWTTVSRESRRVDPAEMPSDLMACISVLMVELHGRFDLPGPGGDNAAFDAEIADVPRLTERRYRCLALYPDTQQSIEILLRLREHHGAGKLSPDFEAEAQRLFRSVDLVLPGEAGARP